MGYYINGIGTSFAEKIANLKSKHNGVVTTAEFKEDLVCIVDNGFMAAAGYCFDKDEFEAFKHDDGRPKYWMVVPNAKELAK